MRQLNTTLPKLFSKAPIITAFLMTFFISTPVISQKQVELHPQVGDTINLIEKLDYLLFTEVPDSLFDHGILIKEGEKYQLTVWHDKDVNEYSVSEEEFEQYAGNVEKLSTYYQRQKENLAVSLEKSPIIKRDSIPLGLDIEWMSAEQRSRMIKESRRYNHLKLDADEMGLMGFDREKYINTGGVLFFE